MSGKISSMYEKGETIGDAKICEKVYITQIGQSAFQMPAFSFVQWTFSELLEATNSKSLLTASPFKARQLDFQKRMPFYSGRKYNKTCKLSHLEASQMLNGRPMRAKDLNPDLLKDNTGDDTEKDLEVMVQDFIENGTSDHGFHRLERDSEDFNTVKHRLQALVSMSSQEREFHVVIASIISSFNEADIDIWSGMKCNGTCIRRLLVKNLRLKGYNAALCSVKWPTVDKIPGGEYEYIDILFSEADSKDRLIIDTDFQLQFKIARPVSQYQEVLPLIPLIFTGNTGKLEQILKFMSEAAKSSLKQSFNHVPPWRTLKYMRAKWFSPFTRITCFDDLSISNAKSCTTSVAHECRDHLQHLKASLTV